MTISVVIPNRDGRAHLEICLPALMRQQVGVPFEVIVVDNASRDDSLMFLQERFPAVEVIALNQNLGFSGGCNRGARHARGEILTFLNNDTQPQENWLAQLYAAIDARPATGLAASNILYFDGRTTDSAGDGYFRCGGAFKRHHGERTDSGRETVDVFGACGAAFMIRRSLFDDLGGFDEDFFLVYEDVDLSYRARLLGATCVFAPEAIVLHIGSASLGHISPAAVFYGQRNLEWAYVKNTPSALFWRTLPAHIAYGLASGAFYAAHGHGFTYLRAKLAACAGLAPMLRKRRQVQRTRQVSTTILVSHMERRWLLRKWREKQFGLGLAKSHDTL